MQSFALRRPPESLTPHLLLTGRQSILGSLAASDFNFVILSITEPFLDLSFRDISGELVSKSFTKVTILMKQASIPCPKGTSRETGPRFAFGEALDLTVVFQQLFAGCYSASEQSINESLNLDEVFA